MLNKELYILRIHGADALKEYLKEDDLLKYKKYYSDESIKYLNQLTYLFESFEFIMWLEMYNQQTEDDWALCLEELESNIKDIEMNRLFINDFIKQTDKKQIINKMKELLQELKELKNSKEKTDKYIKLENGNNINP